MSYGLFLLTFQERDKEACHHQLISLIKKIDRLYISWKIVIRFALDFIFKDAILYLKKWKLKGFSQEGIYFKVQFSFVFY